MNDSKKSQDGALPTLSPQGKVVIPRARPAQSETPVKELPAQTVGGNTSPVLAPLAASSQNEPTQEEPATPQPLPEKEWEWTELGLSAEAIALIEQTGFKKPTGIQAKAIPLALAGRDLIASSQTGTGKTASFVLPMVEKLVGRNGPYGLILAPTREIAQQIQGTLKLFAEPRGIRSAVLIGGIDMRIDQEALAAYPQVIVATPGRLCDHIERGNVWLEYIEFLILDEADRMLDMGFSDQLNRIIQETPTSRQTLLFSATFAGPVEKLAQKILNNPERLAMGRITAAKTVTQRLVFLRDEDDKNRELRAQLREEKGTAIVFTRTKDQATKVYRMLHANNFYDVTYIHSDRLQAHREQALADFKSGKYRILIATDVAGRGIHVDDVAHVVNYDLPLEPEDYIHRVGRTGRAESTGTATSFATRKDKDLLAAIEKLLKGKINEIQPLSQPSSSSNRRDRSTAPAQPAATPGVTAASPVVQSKSRAPRAPKVSPSSGPLRPSQRPGPIRAIDLLPPAEYYEGEMGLDWGWLPPHDERRSAGGDVGHAYHAGNFRPVVNPASSEGAVEEEGARSQAGESLEPSEGESGGSRGKKNRRSGRRRRRKPRSGAPSGAGAQSSSSPVSES